MPVVTEAPAEFQLRTLLARFSEPWRAARIQDLGESAGFSGAWVWRVESGEKAVALRATPEAAVNIQRLRALHRLLGWVNRAGVREVPAPLVWPCGSTFVVAYSHVWQLEPWMPGQADFETNPTRGRLSSAVETLARFHRASESFAPLAEEQSWFLVARLPSPGLNERFRHILRWDAQACAAVRASLLSSDWIEFGELGVRILERYERAAPRIAQSLLLYRDCEVPLQPCLRDVWHDHVLFTGDAVTGLIDAHACRSDCVATDLARLLGTLVGDDASAWEFALRVYQEIRPLNPQEQSLVPLFDQSAVLLNGLTWLDWHVRGRAFPHRQRIIRRLHAIFARLERLA